ncbi:LysE family transporter [Actinomadura macra]|uniref:LysE family transporter n=1 Tax=Actinomadura macra TaxID=46164 RepID=UPI0009FD58A8|nr:LysE family transporter [Actinomadura macra]
MSPGVCWSGVLPAVSFGAVFYPWSGASVRALFGDSLGTGAGVSSAGWSGVSPAAPFGTLTDPASSGSLPGTPAGSIDASSDVRAEAPAVDAEFGTSRDTSTGGAAVSPASSSDRGIAEPLCATTSGGASFSVSWSAPSGVPAGGIRVALSGGISTGDLAGAPFAIPDSEPFGTPGTALDDSPVGSSFDGAKSASGARPAGAQAGASPGVRSDGECGGLLGGSAGRWARADRRAFLRGIGVSGLNPKGLLIFLALLPQFTDPDGTWPVAMQIGVLGLVFMGSCALFYLCLGTVTRTALHARPAAARHISRLSGTAMVGIGVWLLADHLVG